jgi:heat-inducible transcriptional repressor
MDGPGLTVIIGSEHPAPDLQNFSLVASTYADGEAIGAVGVIGPTRMRYSRTIAAVDGMAGLLERVLEDN